MLPRMIYIFNTHPHWLFIPPGHRYLNQAKFHRYNILPPVLYISKICLFRFIEKVMYLKPEVVLPQKSFLQKSECSSNLHLIMHPSQAIILTSIGPEQCYRWQMTDHGRKPKICGSCQKIRHGQYLTTLVQNRDKLVVRYIWHKLWNTHYWTEGKTKIT
jgi:hypothetical protein